LLRKPLVNAIDRYLLIVNAAMINE
jgi:hypothetical protein